MCMYFHCVALIKTSMSAEQKKSMTLTLRDEDFTIRRVIIFKLKYLIKINIMDMSLNALKKYGFFLFCSFLLKRNTGDIKILHLEDTESLDMCGY